MLGSDCLYNKQNKCLLRLTFKTSSHHTNGKNVTKKIEEQSLIKGKIPPKIGKIQEL